MTVTYVTTDDTTVGDIHHTDYQPMRGDTVRLNTDGTWITALIQHVDVQHDTSGKTMVSATINKSSADLS